MATRTTMFGADLAGDRLETLRTRRDEIQQQLDRLVSSPLFRSSRHYPKLLRYVVEQTIEGNAARLKERALGIEVFGRDPDYDTNLDPVVRTSACEVRKRIAQYYHEAGHEQEIRIELPSGSYVPEIHFVESPPAPVAPAGPLVVTIPPSTRTSRRSQWVAGLRAHPVTVGVVAAVLVIGGAAANLRGYHRALDQFWGPIWQSSETVLFCVGGVPGLEAAQRAATPQTGGTPTISLDDVMRYDRMAYSDALTMARILALTRMHEKKYEVRRAFSSSLTDLRREPVVLIGAFNNRWTMQLKKDLRFAFERDESGAMVIRDRKSTTDRHWRIDGKMPQNALAEDYAIVSRVVDPLTETLVVTVAGMTKDGTIAAGEFVTEERYLSLLAAEAPAGWERKNLQVVLATELVNGVPGPPRMVAKYFW